MNALADRDFCAALVLSLGHFLWQGTLIAGLAAIVAKRLNTPHGRYNVLVAAFGLMAISPLATLTIHHLRLEADVPPVIAQETVPDVTAPIVKTPRQATPSNAMLVPVDPMPIERLAEPQSAQFSNAPIQSPPLETGWQRFAPLMMNVYLIGVAVMLIRLVAGLWGGWHLRRRSRLVAEESLLQALRRQASSLGLRLVPLLAYCEQVAVPTVIGVLRPTILLPLTLTSGLAPDQVEVVLAHELAHLRRYDHLVNLLQRFAESLLFFHPAGWWLSNRIRVEREHCCDDLVVACGAVPLDYAKSLLRVAELSRVSKLNRSVSAVSLLATGQPSRLRQRIARLLGDATDTHVRFQHRWPAVVLGMICLLVAWTTTRVGWSVSADSTDKVSIKQTEQTQVAAAETGLPPPMADTNVDQLSKTKADAEPSKLPAKSLAKDVNALPAGAVQRFGTKQFRVYGPFKKIEFSVDGRLILVETSAKLTVLDRETGLEIKDPRYDPGAGWVSKMGVSPDGKLLALMKIDDSSNGAPPNYRVVVMNTESPERRILPWDGYTGEGRTLVFSPDNKTLVGTSQKTGLKLWNLESGQEIATPQWANTLIRAAAFSPNGQTLVLVGQNTWFWKWQTDETPRQLDREFSGFNTAVKYSPDGKWLVTGRAPLGGLPVFDAATLELAWYVDVPQRDQLSTGDTVVISHDSRYLLVGLTGSKRVDVWDLTTRRRAHSFECPEFRSAAFSRDGKWLVVARNDCLIDLRDLSTGKPAVAIPDGHLEAVRALRFTRDGQTLMSGSRDGAARVWDVKTGKQTQRLEEAMGHGVDDVAISPDGRLGVSSSHDNTLAVWDLGTGKRLQDLAGHGSFSNSRPVQFSPDGNKFVSWGEDLFLRWWNTADGKLLSTLETKITAFVPLDRKKADFHVSPRGQFSPDAKTLLVELKGQLYEFDTSTGQERRQFPIGGLFTHFQQSPDRRWLVSSHFVPRDPSSDTSKNVSIVTLRDFETQKVAWELKVPAFYIAGLEFSPDSQSLAFYAGDDAKSIDVVNVQTGEVSARIPEVSRCDAFQFTPDGKHLASAHYDSTVMLWDVEKFRTNAKVGDVGNSSPAFVSTEVHATSTDEQDLSPDPRETQLADLKSDLNFAVETLPATLAERIEKALQVSEQRRLTVGLHSPWQIMNGMKAFGRDWPLLTGQGDTKTLRIDEWVASGPRYQGKAVWQITQMGARAHPFDVKFSFESQPGQFLAYLAEADIPIDFVLRAQTADSAGTMRQISVRDVLNDTKHRLHQGGELTWALWAIAHYEPIDAEWTDGAGSKWTIPRLVEAELEGSIINAAVGGCPRLYALAVARDKYRKSVTTKGEPLPEVWRKVDEMLAHYIDRTKSFQSPDGSFSAQYYRGTGLAKDFNERLSSTGAQLAWLVIALPTERFTEEWVTRAVDRLSTDLIEHRTTPTDVGAICYAVHALRLYRERKLGVDALPDGNGLDVTSDAGVKRVNPDVPELEKVFQRAKPSMVIVNTEKPDTRSERKVQGVATGFIVDVRGYILTTSSVLADADPTATRVTLDGSATYPAELISVDDARGLALLRITPKSPMTLPTLGRSKGLKVGDPVVSAAVIFENKTAKVKSLTAASGVIGALHRDIDLGRPGEYTNLIQTNVKVFPGGGPLLNSAGEVIGIIVALRVGEQRLAFAKEIDDVRPFLERAIPPVK